MSLSDQMTPHVSVHLTKFLYPDATYMYSSNLQIHSIHTLMACRCMFIPGTDLKPFILLNWNIAFASLGSALLIIVLPDFIVTYRRQVARFVCSILDILQCSTVRYKFKLQKNKNKFYLFTAINYWLRSGLCPTQKAENKN